MNMALGQNGQVFGRSIEISNRRRLPNSFANRAVRTANTGSFRTIKIIEEFMSCSDCRIDKGFVKGVKVCGWLGDERAVSAMPCTRPISRALRASKIR